MKYLFAALCWLVPAAGLLIACTKKPKQAYPPHEFRAPDQADNLAATDPNEAILDLEAPTWSILFGFDSYSLKEAHKAAAIAEYLHKTGASVFLAGHASEEGPEAYNLALAARRAVAVRNYLEAAGISPDRMAWQSFGEDQPATRDPEKIHLNRRVQITIERKTP